MNRIPPLLRFLALATALYLGAFSLMRIAFWYYFDAAGDPLPQGELLTALYLGLKFDLRLVLLLLLPLFLLGWLPWLNPLRRRWAYGFWLAYLALASAAALLFYIIDFGHYAYLQIRLDASALRFLKNLDISLQMVWETYPVLTLTLGLAACVALLTYLAQRLLQHYARQPVPVYGWKGKTVAALVSTFLLLFGLYGKVSAYPLRWSDAFFGTHTFAAQVTFNPVLYFADTLRAGGGAVYDEEAVRAHYGEMAAYLGVTEPDPATLNFRRTFTPAKPLAQQPNVVIVIMESFASYKSGLAGNPLDPTPYLDALARDGYYFKNFYTPQTGTARSIFCAITGIPDVETNSTSSRNPRIVEQHTIINSFDGYEKFYFLGGSASWGNIRGLLSANIPGLHLYEEGSYSAPVIDVWGISDLDLFREADKVFQQQQAPFFAIVQTSGNHRPYTIPADNAGFELKQADAETLQRYGFHSVEEYNSYRFMDHSIGQFMQLAKEAGYLDNTIFAFFGDHGLPGHAEHAAKADVQLDFTSNRVPFIIYSPKLIPQGKIVDAIASETDVLATLASLAGRTYTNTTLGRNLFDPRFGEKRYAFKVSWARPLRIGLIGNEFFFEMSADNSNKHLHRLDSATPREDVAAQYPEQSAAMEQMTRAYYETAKYMLYHNKPVKP